MAEFEVEAPPEREAWPATVEEFDTIVELINAAYKVELGNTGEGFKNSDRIATEGDRERLRKKIEDGDVLVIRADGEICAIGVVNEQVSDDGKRVLFCGPLAVPPHLQKRGYGARLVMTMREIARQRGCARLEGTVVSFRESLLPYYARLGFREVKRGPLDIPASRLVRDGGEFVYIAMDV